VNQLWILRNSKDMLDYVRQGISPYSIALKHLTTLPFAKLFTTHSYKTNYND